MKAIRIHAPKAASIDEVPMPEHGPDDVLVRVRAVAICATDIELFDGTMFYLTSGMTGYPFTPGHEWSGEVVETGSRVVGFSIGDCVVGECSIGCRSCRQCLSGHYHLCGERKETGLLKQQGAMAEFISFPYFYLHKVSGLSFEAAALVEPTAVAIGAVRKVKITPSDRVAIMGAGPIGLFAVQVAKAYGARQIIVIDQLDERLRLAVELGADTIINFKNQSMKEQVAQATEGMMVDVVIEAVGREDVWPMIASIVASSARIAMTGLFAGAICGVDFDPLVTKEVTIYGSLGSPNVWPEAISLHRRNLVRTESMITHRLPLAEFSRAIEISRKRIDGAVKVLMQP